MNAIGLKKRLVYHLYVPDHYVPEIYKYHFACLKYFANVFDEYVINLVMENPDDADTIKKMEIMFLSYMYKNITFNVVQNDKNIREVYTFKTEIIDKISSSNTLTFFAHSKGMTNDFNESLIRWICYMYYFSLNFIDNMYYKLLGSTPRIFYGPMIYYADILTPVKYHWLYPGSFYWINMPSLYNYSLMYPLPKIEGRCYAENFPGNITNLKTAALHEQLGVAEADYYFDDCYATSMYDFYNDCQTPLNYCFMPERLEKFYEFENYIRSNLEEI